MMKMKIKRLEYFGEGSFFPHYPRIRRTVRSINIIDVCLFKEICPRIPEYEKYRRPLNESQEFVELSLKNIRIRDLFLQAL